MNWVRHGGSTTFETKSSYCRVARQGLPCYTAVARLGFKRRATAVLKSNLIRHGSSTTFDTGLNCWRTMTSESSFLELSLPLTLELPHSHSRLIENKGFGWNKIQPREDKGAILSWYNSPFLFYNICRLFFLKIAQWNAKEKKKRNLI